MLAAAHQHGPPAPFWQVPVFWVGVGLARPASRWPWPARGSAGPALPGTARHPAFGLAAWTALAWVGGAEEHGKLGRRAEMLAEHERKLQESFDRERCRGVWAAAKQLGVASVAELREALERLGVTQAAAAEARTRLEGGV